MMDRRQKPQMHLAIDIGASGGRHILGWREHGQIVMREMYRFTNGARERDGSLVWDLDALFSEVLNGLTACKAANAVPDSVGIDTWGVDYVLLDRNDAPILPVYCYRDKRGAAAVERVHAVTPFETLYERTGIQFQPFNTVYQMYADKMSGRLGSAADWLMLPSYLLYRLTGVKMHEYTNATTTGLLHARTRQWDAELIRALGFPEHLFVRQPIQPPALTGRLLPEIRARVGFDCDAILPATHDTGSAVASLPQRGAYLSSGTWSLLGAETDTPVTTDAALRANFTNEGGVNTIRLQKNIMGLWLVQCLQRELGGQHSFAELASLARENAGFPYRLDVNGAQYLAPDSVRDTIARECTAKGCPIPQTAGEFAHAIFQSLAFAYADALKELESITKMRYDTLCIVGGGSRNAYLNELTGIATGHSIVTGSAEATALGNILLQEACYV